MGRERRFDYIIVGAGSAGCVLANRLSDDPDHQVLLIEAGPPDRSLMIHMPAGVASLLDNPSYGWGYSTEPDPTLGGRQVVWPRGRVLGGSSSINGMAYVRGHQLDYERWADAGLDGWSYANVLPYFKRAETYSGAASPYRGTDGPLFVMQGPASNAIYQAYLAAGQEAGYGITQDQNGARQEGFSRMDMTIHHGRRCSTSLAYLKPIRRRSNLTVITNVLVTRILFDKVRATGVEVAEAEELEQMSADREVILCGGVVNSPQLLMLSGIGPANSLKGLGITPRIDLPGVGQNLQDHAEVYIQYQCTKPWSLYGAFRPHRKFMIGLEWLLFRSGLAATNHSEAGAFIRVGDGATHPDIQHHFVPMAFSSDTKAPLDCHSFQVHVSPMRPQSRGQVRLKTTDPRNPPTIEFPYYGAQADLTLVREAVKATREVFAQPAFGSLRGQEIAPGEQVRSNQEIEAFLRATTETAYHPCGTAKMGHDLTAVVDPEGRVHGVERLRVVDASIMPTIVSGNLNAPVIMMAEKIADHILGHLALPPEHLPFDQTVATAHA